MLFRRCTIFIISILAFLYIMGCSSNENPSQNMIESGSSSYGSSQPVYISDWNADGTPSAGSGTLGLFNFRIDPVNVDAEIISLRQSKITDVLETVDITNFLMMAPCYDCVSMGGVSLDIDGNIVVSLGIRHPFGAGDPLKPISGQNRADLHVFNVEGIIISDNSASVFPGLGESAANFNLVNADGYTGYLDDSIDEFYPTDATVHPYILHFDDYESGNFDPANPFGFENVTDPGPSGNLVMPMGSDYDYQDYVFDLDDGPIEFIFAVGCTYAVSAATKSLRFEPEYRIPQHNKKAASEIDVVISDNQLRGGVISSSADVEIRVVDISHSVETGDQLDQMFLDSSVQQISIEIPGVLASQVLIDGNSSTSGSGMNPSDPLIYETIITNSASGAMGTYAGLVKISDSYVPGQNTSPLLSGSDGISRVDPVVNPLDALFIISEFATYQVFEIDVAAGCGPITGSVLNHTCGAISIGNGGYLDFEVSASSDNGGDPITLYEVDYDYDGSNFTVDDSNIDGLFYDVGPYTVPDPCPDNIPQTYTTAFRAIDSCSDPNVTIFSLCDVTVDSCLVPVGNVVLTVNYVETAPSLHGYEFDPSNPWTLDWDAVSGAQEYAIYYDNDPSDGLKTEPLLLVGTITNTTYDVPVSHLPSNHYVTGYTYYVCSRATVGGADADESEPAFVMASGFETGTYFDSECEGWVGHCQANTTDFRYRPYVDGWGLIHFHGSNNVFFSNQFFGPDDNNRWHGWAVETPTVDDSSVRYLTFTCRSYYIWPDHGMFVGTISGTSLPQYNWTSPQDMQWASVDSTGDFVGYDYECPQIASTFTDVPMGVNTGWYTYYNPPFDTNWYDFLIGGDVNTGGATSNVGNSFVAIELVKLDLDYRAPQTVADEIAIAIY